MKTELRDKYPKILTGVTITTPDGWFTILDNLCLLIRGRLKYEKGISQVVAVQIKEKFGELRFYYTGGDQYVAGLVAMAEAMSTVTCENCGHPGESRRPGWVATLCDECNNKRKENDIQ